MVAEVRTSDLKGAAATPLGRAALALFSMLLLASGCKTLERFDLPIIPRRHRIRRRGTAPRGRPRL